MVSCEWLRRISSLCPLPRFFLVVRISSLCAPLPDLLRLTYGRGVFADSTPHRTHARRQQDSARLTENGSHEAEQFNRNNKEKLFSAHLPKARRPPTRRDIGAPISLIIITHPLGARADGATGTAHAELRTATDGPCLFVRMLHRTINRFQLLDSNHRF